MEDSPAVVPAAGVWVKERVEEVERRKSEQEERLPVEVDCHYSDLDLKMEDLNLTEQQATEHLGKSSEMAKWKPLLI